MGSSPGRLFVGNARPLSTRSTVPGTRFPVGGSYGRLSPLDTKPGTVDREPFLAAVQSVVYRGENFIHRDLQVAIRVAGCALDDRRAAECDVHHRQDLIDGDLKINVAVAHAGSRADRRSRRSS